MSGATSVSLGLGRNMEVRINHLRRDTDDDEGQGVRTDAHFYCRCGWVHHSSHPRRLVIPDVVKDHQRVCEYAAPGQTTIDDLLDGAV